MASQAPARPGAERINMKLIGVLAILIVIGLLYLISNKKQQSDPTLTAAPPTISTPGHPAQHLMKSPEVMALQEKLDGETNAPDRPLNLGSK